MTAGTTLFALDCVLVVVLWPLVMWAAGQIAPLLAVPTDPRGVVYPAMDLLLLYAMGLYRRDALIGTRKSMERVPLVVGMGCGGALLVALLLPVLSPNWFLAVRPPNQGQFFALAIVCFAFCAFAARMLAHLLLRKRVLGRRLLVVGAGQRAWDLLHMLTHEGRTLRYDIVFLHDPSLGAIDPRLEADPAVRIVQPEAFDVLLVAKGLNADQIVIAPDERRGMNLERLLACKMAGFPIVQYLSFVEQEIHRIDIKRLELSWVLFSDGFQFSSIDRALKQVFDIVVSIVTLLVTSPFLLAAMLAIRWEGPGPILYRQERVTQYGRHFKILKLRTMRVDAEAGGAVWAASKDARITRVGALLRRTRLDELPQLINVLRGDMSFVGPRPERPMFVAELAEKIPLYNERHAVKAGLTGWAQVNYPYGASIDDARSKLSYDLYYVKNFSILFDLRIIVQTLRVVLWPQGVR